MFPRFFLTWKHAVKKSRTVFINSCLLHNTSLRTQFSELSTLKLRSVESKWFQELLFPLSTLQTSCKKQIFNPAMLPEKLKLMSKRKIIISWLPIYLFYRTSCKLKVSSSCSIDCRITLNLSLLKTYIAANDFYIDHFIEASTRLNWNLDGHRSALSSNVRSPERLKMKEKNMDSGLVVVVLIITSLVITVFSFLLFVDYEWCHVLFKNNTVRYFYYFLLLLSVVIKLSKLDLNRKLNRHFS